MSIKQNFKADALPDFRNLGVVARILLGTNALAFAAVLAAAPGWAAAMERFMLLAAAQSLAAVQQTAGQANPQLAERDDYARLLELVESLRAAGVP